jgi:hypothetical protein
LMAALLSRSASPARTQASQCTLTQVYRLTKPLTIQWSFHPHLAVGLASEGFKNEKPRQPLRMLPRLLTPPIHTGPASVFGED